MPEPIMLAADESLAAHPFTDPAYSLKDLERMQGMAHQLVDTYDDPVVCDFTPGKRAVCQSDPLGRHFRIYYLQPQLLFQQNDITVVGFFGHKRPGADVKPLIQADKQFETVFHKNPGLLSLSTVRLPDGDFGNLVLFTDPESRDQWNNMPLHRDLVAKISPPYYEYVRLNHAILPDGLDEPDSMRLVRTRYLEFNPERPWFAVRDYA
jgi:hypothetical protein